MRSSLFAIGECTSILLLITLIAIKKSGMLKNCLCVRSVSFPILFILVQKSITKYILFIFRFVKTN